MSYRSRLERAKRRDQDVREAELHDLRSSHGPSMQGRSIWPDRGRARARREAARYRARTGEEHPGLDGLRQLLYGVDA